MGMKDYFSASPFRKATLSGSKKPEPLTLIYKQMKIKTTTGKGRFLQDNKPL